MKNLLKLTFLVILTISCNSRKNHESKEESAAAVYEIALMPPPPQANELSSLKNEDRVSTSEPFDKNQKLIKEGNIKFETDNLNETKKYIFEKTKALKGYVANESQNKLYDRNEISISLRIPAEHFDDIMNSISETAKSIDERNISVRDVTEDYRDHELRAKNKKEVENRYRELLKKANKVEEILSIEDKLGEIRTEIENSEGHINYLQNRIKYSTLEINFYKKNGESNLSKFTFFESLKKGWKMLIDVLNSLFSFWPFFIILVILYLGIKNYRKKRNSKN